jgi:tetratricopeptide (TPR) repeat protein
MRDIIGKVADLNNHGIVHEKCGDIESAIRCYEDNIQLRYPTTHAYDRLMVIYRRRGQVDAEIRVINIAIEVFTKEIERRTTLGGYTANIEETVDQYRRRIERRLKQKQAKEPER